MSERSARRFMEAGKVYGSKTATVADLAPSALYELAAPRPRRRCRPRSSAASRRARSSPPPKVKQILRSGPAARARLHAACSKGHCSTLKIVASPTSYSDASCDMVSPAAYRSAILRFWPTSRAEVGRTSSRWRGPWQCLPRTVP